MTGTVVPCALCGATDTRELYLKFEWGIGQCRACRLVYANPRAPEAAILARYSREYFWEEYLPAVGAPGGRVDPDFLDRRHGPMLRLLRTHAPHGGRLLEVGTGAGLFLKAAERAGWSAAGLELSPDGASFARERLGLDVRTERAEAMSFAPGSFDVAVMFDVIEHLFEPRAVLASIHRALRPGGTLAIATPNFDALSRTVLGIDWAVLSPLEHLYYFTEGTLRALVEAVGFRDVTRVHRFDGWGTIETMNYHCTHAAGSWRARTYGLAVESVGRAARGIVQRTGRADALLCLATT